MGFIKKYSPFITAILAITLYFFSRLYNILALPIFTDEAIYIRWSQIALNDASWRFISLTDGKQPMYVWIAMIFLRFVNEPLLAGRLVSVLSGFLTMIGLFFLTKEVFKSPKAALLACFIYILFPFALVYDRIALYDSLVAMFIIWSIYFEILFVKHLRLDLALILGMTIGGGMLTKTSANFALILLPFSLLLFNFKIKNLKQKLFLWFIYGLVAAGIANLIYLVLRLSPFFYIIEQKNNLFIYTPGEWLLHPFSVFLSNMNGFIDWIVGYATIPFLVLLVTSVILKSKFRKEIAFLVLWFIVPLISTAFFGRLVYPRFLLFMILPLIPIVSFALYMLINKTKNIWLKTLILLAFLGMFIIKDFFIITDFKNAPIPQADMGQFLTGWPSGVGVSQTVKFLQEEAKNKKIFVGTQGTFGLMPFSLEIYLGRNPNIEIMGYWPTKDQPPKEVIAKTSKMPVYFVFYQACEFCKNIGVAPDSWPVKKIFQIEKEQKGQFYTLYRIE